MQPDCGHRDFSFFGELQQISGNQLRWRRQGRDAAGLGPLLEGAPGGGVTQSGVGGNAAAEGVLDALSVLVGEAGGIDGGEGMNIYQAFSPWLLMGAQGQEIPLISGHLVSAGHLLLGV